MLYHILHHKYGCPLCPVQSMDVVSLPSFLNHQFVRLCPRSVTVGLLWCITHGSLYPVWGSVEWGLAPSQLDITWEIQHIPTWSQCQKLGKIFIGLTDKLLLSLVVITTIYRSSTPNKTTFSKYCLTQWISKLPRSIEIHWIRQYLVNFMGLAGMLNTSVCKTVNFHRSWAWQIVLNFNTLIHPFSYRLL